MDSDQEELGPKKRGRKPKQKTDLEEETGQRKRGRKKKFQIETINKLRDSTVEEDKIVTISNNDNFSDLENQVQVSFGSLNITVYNSAPVDKNELRKNFDSDFNMKLNEKAPSILLQDRGEKIAFGSSDKKQKFRFEFDEEETPKVVQKESKEPEYQQIKKVKKVHRILQEYNGSKWPTKTNVWCWWCCHPFDTEPVPCPFNYDEVREVFETKGMFCSWECCAAYSVDNYKSLTYVYELMNKLYDVEIDGKVSKNFQDFFKDFTIAPNKLCLKVFGGYMNIDEFRSNKKNINISTEFISYVNQDILEIYNEIKNKKKK